MPTGSVTRVLLAVFSIPTPMVGWLAVTTALTPLKIACLTIVWFLGRGNGAFFKLVAQYLPGRTGAVRLIYRLGAATELVPYQVIVTQAGWTPAFVHHLRAGRQGCGTRGW